MERTDEQIHYTLFSHHSLLLVRENMPTVESSHLLEQKETLKRINELDTLILPNHCHGSESGRDEFHCSSSF